MALTEGEEPELISESSVEIEKGIEVKLLNNNGSIVSEHVFKRNGTLLLSVTLVSDAMFSVKKHLLFHIK